MIVRRSVSGFALIAWLALLYTGALVLRRVLSGVGDRCREGVHRHGSRLAAAFARRHGGLLIKIAQYVASRPDIFPLAYVDACAPLRDQAPARPWPVIRAALDEAYEGRLAEHLAKVEETPLAAASFGQVHRAWLAVPGSRDAAQPALGALVAVKIQYPGLAALVAVDLRLVRLVLWLLRPVLPGWPLDLIHDEIQRTSREEQDYLAEGMAADRIRVGAAQHGVLVPQVLWPHTREKILVMEFAQGTTMARLDLGALPEAVRHRLADRLIDAFLQQLLVDGFFHADPHAGNLVYDAAADRLWLIDFGMTATISRRESELYRRFLGHMGANDTDGMVDVLVELGFVLPDADRLELRALVRQVWDQLAHLDPRTFKGSRREIELGARIADFLRRVRGLVFPRHTMLLGRATGLVEGVCMELVPGVNLLDLVKPRVKRITGLKMRLRHILDEAKEFYLGLRSLPDKVAALAGGKPQSLTPLLAAVLLLAALQLEPSAARTTAAACAAIALLFTVFRR